MGMTSAKDNTPDRTCSDPGDQEHDHTMCQDVAVERAGLLAERFGPLPVRDPGKIGRRLQAIATLHALADWFAAHPDVPAPTHVVATCVVADATALEELATAMDQRIFGDRPMFTIDDPISPWTRDGLNQAIYVTVPAPRDERPL